MHMAWGGFSRSDIPHTGLLRYAAATRRLCCPKAGSRSRVTTLKQRLRSRCVDTFHIISSPDNEQKNRSPSGVHTDDRYRGHVDKSNVRSLLNAPSWAYVHILNVLQIGTHSNATLSKGYVSELSYLSGLYWGRPRSYRNGTPPPSHRIRASCLGKACLPRPRSVNSRSASVVPSSSNVGLETHPSIQRCGTNQRVS